MYGTEDIPSLFRCLPRETTVSDATQHDLTELAMDTRVGQLVRKSPMVCLPTTPLQQVFEAMEREKAGSMLVADESGAIQGILTRYDLIKRILLPQLPLSTPINQVMSTGIKTIDADSGALEAMLVMARHKVRHLPVLQHGFLWAWCQSGICSTSSAQVFGFCRPPSSRPRLLRI